MDKLEIIIDKIFKNNRLRIIKMGLSLSGSSLITLWMKNNVKLITLFLLNLEPFSALFLWGGLVFTLEGIIFTKSHINIGEENKKNDIIGSNEQTDSSKKTSIKLFMFTVLSYLYLFFNPLLKLLLFNKYLIIIVLLINFISVFLILGELMKLVHVIIKTFLNSVPDSKDRLAFAITFMGSIISLIALIK